MWALIIISHILMGLSFILLAISSLKGHFIINDFSLTLQSFSIIAILTYVFTQTLILFLIITINKEIKNLLEKNSDTIDYSDYIQYKKKMHIHTSFNLIFIAVLAILFAAVHIGLMGVLMHRIFFVIALLHYAYTIKIQYCCFKEISKLIVRLNDMIITKL